MTADAARTDTRTGGRTAAGVLGGPLSHVSGSPGLRVSERQSPQKRPALKAHEPAPGARALAREAPIAEPENVDFELEERFLGWCLIDPRALDSVTGDVFWLPENRLFFETLREIGTWADADVIVERLLETGRLEAAGGAARIADFFERIEPTANAPRAAQRLTRLLALRDARAAAMHAAVAIDAGHVEPALASLREAARRLKAAQ